MRGAKLMVVRTQCVIMDTTEKDHHKQHQCKEVQGGFSKALNPKDLPTT